MIHPQEWQQEKTPQLSTYLNKSRDYEKMDVSEVDFSRRIKAQPKEQYVKQFLAESLKTLSRTKSKLRKELSKLQKKVDALERRGSNKRNKR